MPLPIREFSAAARPLLEALGLQRRAGEQYTLELEPDVLAWVGLSRMTEHRVLVVSPMVGVRHQAVERLVAELLGLRFRPYSPATILSALGYLMPQGRWVPWRVEDEAAAVPRAVEIAGAIADFGLPAARRYATLEAIERALSAPGTMGSPRRATLIPVVLSLLDRTDEARDVLARELETRRDRLDAEAQDYRRFADRLRDVWDRGLGPASRP